MYVEVWIHGNDINRVRYSLLQGVIGLPVEFDSAPVKDDLMHFSDHPMRQRPLFPGGPIQIRLPDLPHQLVVCHDKGLPPNSISSAIASWTTPLSSSTVISVILRFMALITSPPQVNPLIISEKPKENN
jgi:hypothetical protein